MLAETISIWRKNFIYFVGYTVLMVLTTTLLGGSARGSSALGFFGVGQLYIGYLVQRAVIFDTPFSTRKSPEGGGRIQYVLKGLALGFMMLVPALVAAIFAGMTLGRMMVGQDKPKLFLIVAIVVVCFFIVKILLGTWLPASIKGENTSLSKAFARGVQGFWRLFFRTLSIALASLVVSFLAAIVVGVALLATGVNVKALDPKTMYLFAGLFALINLFFTSMVDVLFALEVRDEDGPSSSLRRSHFTRYTQVISRAGMPLSQNSREVIPNRSGRPQFGRR